MTRLPDAARAIGFHESARIPECRRRLFLTLWSRTPASRSQGEAASRRARLSQFRGPPIRFGCSCPFALTSRARRDRSDPRDHACRERFRNDADHGVRSDASPEVFSPSALTGPRRAARSGHAANDPASAFASPFVPARMREDREANERRPCGFTLDANAMRCSSMCGTCELQGCIVDAAHRGTLIRCMQALTTFDHRVRGCVGETERARTHA